MSVSGSIRRRRKRSVTIGLSNSQGSCTCENATGFGEEPGMWSGHDTTLVVDAAVAVLVVVVLVARFDVHAFLALMIASLAMGLASGLGVSKLVDSFEGG